MLDTPSLLITDDDRDFRESIRDVFEPHGFRTILAENGQEAVEIVQEDEVHLVLLDMHMPKLTGLEAIREIKKLRETLPCILISGKLDDQIRAQAQAAFRVLPKPISRLEITSTVENGHSCYLRLARFQHSVAFSGWFGA